jgi:tripartite-type tricarboxylate transporter receptor subunit TctC
MYGKMRITAALLLAVAAVGFCEPAAAQSYPTRPVTIITPTAAGGGIDLTARQIAAELQAALGKPFVVVNKGGADGNIGTLDVARAAPDGYTLLLTISGYQATNPALFLNLQWDPVRDFTGVAMISRSYHMIVVNKDFPANTLGELIAYARANPGKLNFGSPSVGSQTTIGSQMLAQMAGIDVVAVPYRGTGPAFNDLLGGTLGFFVNTSQQLIGPLQGHLIKGLAIMSPKRHPQLPDLPTTAEAGLPGLQIDTWYALYAPAGTPKEIVDLLGNKIKEFTDRADFRARVEQTGATMYYMGPDELTKFTAQEVVRWTNLIHKLGIPAQ